MNAPIVESPAEARNTSKHIGWIAKPCIGHIRNLPSRKTDIPEKYVDKSRAKPGINMDGGYEAIYIPRSDAIEKLESAAEKAGNTRA